MLSGDSGASLTGNSITGEAPFVGLAGLAHFGTAPLQALHPKPQILNLKTLNNKRKMRNATPHTGGQRGVAPGDADKGVGREAEVAGPNLACILDSPLLHFAQDGVVLFCQAAGRARTKWLQRPGLIVSIRGRGEPPPTRNAVKVNLGK